MNSIHLNVSSAEQRRIKELLGALRAPYKESTLKSSQITPASFIEEFRSRLFTTHNFLNTILMEDAFEVAFIRSAEAAGLNVIQAPAGQRFWDVEIEGQKISLKSTKAKNLSENTLHISKLCEAAWIQDCRTAAKRRQKTIELFTEYCQNVDSIIQFRYFGKSNKYQLVKIPVKLFEEILCLDRKHFTADGPTIDIPIGQNPPNFSLKIDRSDSKITLAKINIKVCDTLAEWTLCE